MIRIRTSFWQWLLAAIVSVTLWIVSMRDHHFEVTARLPVSAPELPDDYMILEANTAESISVNFSGKGIGVLRDQIFRRPWIVDIASPEPDPDRAYPQNRSIILSEDDVIYRGGRYSTLSVVSFFPDNVSFTLDRKISRLLPVSIESENHIPQRYQWSSLSSTYAQLTGAASVINNLDSCYTIPIGTGDHPTEIEVEKPPGIIYINPSLINAELIRPVAVVSRLQRQ